MRTLNTTLAVAIGACSLAAPAWSAPEAGAKAMLEEVVVTARRVPRIVMEASETVSVIDHEQLRRNTAYGLADAMRGLPGLQVTDGGQPGLKRVRIRGEESRRTAILLDGQEITDHWEYGTPLSLNPLLVERIEVVRGSGSVLYGPRALSGVVNFITRKGGTEPLQFEASSGWNSATDGLERFASVFGDLQGLGYRVAVSDSDHDERDTPDGEIGNTAFDNNSVYAWIGRDFGAHRLELLYDRYESATDVFVEEEQRTAFPLTDFRIDVPQRDREKIGLSYQWSDVADFLPLVKLHANRASNDRQFDTFSSTFVPGPRPLATDRSVYSDAELEMDDVVVQFDWIPAHDHYIVSGIQYSEERVTQDRHVDIVSNGVTGRPEDIRDEAAIETLALFVQDEWRIGERSTLTIGARQYRVEGSLDETNRAGLAPGENDDSHLIANLGISHELSDNVVLRANVAQGYVYPSLLQFAIGAYAASRYVNPNPDLKPETALSWEAGVRVRALDWVFDAGVFRSESEDYIDIGCIEHRKKDFQEPQRSSTDKDTSLIQETTNNQESKEKKIKELNFLIFDETKGKKTVNLLFEKDLNITDIKKIELYQNDIFVTDNISLLSNNITNNVYPIILLGYIESFNNIKIFTEKNEVINLPLEQYELDKITQTNSMIKTEDKFELDNYHTEERINSFEGTFNIVGNSYYDIEIYIPKKLKALQILTQTIDFTGKTLKYNCSTDEKYYTENNLSSINFEALIYQVDKYNSNIKYNFLVFSVALEI